MSHAPITFRGVRTDQLQSNKANVRDHLDGIDELAASIRSNGILQPLIVNDQAGTFVVTDGHRRLEAARRAGVPVVPCLVTVDADDKHVVTTMLAAAMHRELRPIEQGRAFARLRAQGVTTADIARSTGYSVAVVSNRLLLLELPREAQDMVDDDTLTIAAATDLAKQVRAKKSGSAATGKKQRTVDLLKSHPLAAALELACDHHATRQLVGGKACFQCLEQTIRDDERARANRGAAA